MRALRFENNQLAVDDVPLPARSDEVLIRVKLAGVCNTDLEIARGYAGFQGTLGHEFVGTVEHGSDSHFAGARVVGEINAGCSECFLCRSGDSRHCADRTVLGIVGRDGAFAEFLQLPARNLVLVPDNVTDERAVFAEPLAAACGILERFEVEPWMKVAILGDGKLGILCAQALRALTNADEVTLIGRHDSKLDIVRRRSIQTAKPDELPTSFRRAFDVVVEASGSPDGLRNALDLLRPRGVLMLKSTFHGTTDLNLAPVVVDEISIVGSRCGRFAPALELLEQNAVDVESLIDREFSLEQGIEGMQRAQESGVLKVLIRPNAA